MDITKLQQEYSQKLKKSDALSFLKEVSQSLSKEDFLEFCNVAMLDAYRGNRVKAVEYMLPFHEKNQPKTLIMIHLQRMLFDENDFESGKKMLVPLAKHFSQELCQETMTNFINHNGKKSEYFEREKGILTILLNESLEISEVKIKRPKL